MASFEGIRFAFPAQAPVRSPKLRIYENLFLWKQGVDQLVAVLRTMQKFPFAGKKALQYAQAEIEEVRAEVNADFMEDLADREQDDAGRFWQERRTYEKKREDPDDIYMEVQRREEERKKLGLPSRLGIVPYSAVADDARIVGEEQERKKRRGTRRLPTSSAAKTAVRGRSRNHDFS